MKINPIFSLFTSLTIAVIVGFSLSSSFKFPYELNQSSKLILNYDIKLDEDDQNQNFDSENQKSAALIVSPQEKSASKNNFSTSKLMQNKFGRCKHIF